MKRLLDAQAEWVMRRLSARAQLRLGIVCLWISVPFYLYLPFSGEPPAVFVMSALALTLSGAAFIVGAEVLLDREESKS